MRSLLARNPVGSHVLDLSTTGTPIANSGWTQVVSASSAPACAVEICNTTGRILEISTGDVGDEDASKVPYTILPSGSPILLPLEVARGKPISLQAVDGDTTEGFLILNLFG